MGVAPLGDATVGLAIDLNRALRSTCSWKCRTDPAGPLGYGRGYAPSAARARWRLLDSRAHGSCQPGDAGAIFARNAKVIPGGMVSMSDNSWYPATPTRHALAW